MVIVLENTTANNNAMVMTMSWHNARLLLSKVDIKKIWLLAVFL